MGITKLVHAMYIIMIVKTNLFSKRKAKGLDTSMAVARGSAMGASAPSSCVKYYLEFLEKII